MKIMIRNSKIITNIGDATDKAQKIVEGAGAILIDYFYENNE